jgi:hypothetical protein
VAWSTVSTVKPAASRSEVAVASSSPTTSGTGTPVGFGLPFETVTNTVPRWTISPGRGLWPTTVPVGSEEGT